jgi:hypothetical protein
MTALVYENLLAAIGAAPALPGARCKNRAPLYDPAAPGENFDTVSARHNGRRCPSLTRCQTWLLGLKPSRRPLGVVAGQVNRGPGDRERRPPGRPRKAVS